MNLKNELLVSKLNYVLKDNRIRITELNKKDMPEYIVQTNSHIELINGWMVVDGRRFNPNFISAHMC